MSQPPPLDGIRVLEFTGLAPGPFAGLLLADHGATVLRVDAIPRPGEPNKEGDVLTRRKKSIAVDLKSVHGLEVVKSMLPLVDVVIDPFRPGVLERLGLDPKEVMLKINPRLIVGRMTGFRRDGKYAYMAGHDINYIAVSGALSMLGRAGEKPYAPGNILGDFAGGGAVCFMGIVLALIHRWKTGSGQIVEANMVDGSAYMTTFLRLALKTPVWNQERGRNLLDGGAPFYDTYETKDGKYMSVGCNEPQFFAAFIRGLGLEPSSLPGEQYDFSAWPALRDLFTKKFKSKTRQEWESIFDGTDACCAPVLTYAELESAKYEQRPVVTLRDSPALAISKEGKHVERGQGDGVPFEGYASGRLTPGEGGEEVLAQWAGWKKDKDYTFRDGGIVSLQSLDRSKL